VFVSRVHTRVPIDRSVPTPPQSWWAHTVAWTPEHRETEHRLNELPFAKSVPLRHRVIGLSPFKLGFTAAAPVPRDGCYGGESWTYSVPDGDVTRTVVLGNRGRSGVRCGSSGGATVCGPSDAISVGLEIGGGSGGPSNGETSGVRFSNDRSRLDGEWC
jgi:hypothetical protein